MQELAWRLDTLKDNLIEDLNLKVNKHLVWLRFVTDIIVLGVAYCSMAILRRYIICYGAFMYIHMSYYSGA